MQNNKTHKEDEQRRLDDGQEGCGCSICQELYKTLDLAKYGARVKEKFGIIYIGAKITRPEKPVIDVRANPTDVKQGAKPAKVKPSRGRMTPTKNLKPSVARPVKPKTISSCKKADLTNKAPQLPLL